MNNQTNLLDYDYFEHEADIGIIGRGKSLTEAFEAAATSVFAIMADISVIQPKQTVDIKFQEEDAEFALVTWINMLLAKAREHGLMFSQFELKKINHQWHGVARGESWGKVFEHGTEVKGATLTNLRVEQKEKNQWEARCVVDV